MLEDKRVAFIGVGNMGEAILRRLLEMKVLVPGQITVAEKTQERQMYLNTTYGVETTDIEEAVRLADIIFLGVKPQQLAEMPAFTTQAKVTVISMLAGTKIATIQKHFPGAGIARIMPNLAFGVGHGVIGLAFDTEYSWSEDQKNIVSILLTQGGTVLEVSDESRMNEITAVSGSGPAYFYWFSEQLTQAAVQLGFTAEDADKLVREVLIGVASSLKDNPDTTLAEFRQRVTSKGGTTEAALSVFNSSDTGAIVTTALEAARDRSRELSL